MTQSNETMRYWATNLASLVIFLVASPLVASQLSAAPNNSSPPKDTQTSPRTQPPTCTDLSKVQGPVIEFGSVNSSTPYSIRIDSNGYVKGTQVNRVSPSTVRALLRLASAEGFWTIPGDTGEFPVPRRPGEFVQVNLSCARHRVVFKKTAEIGPIAEMHTLLEELVGMKKFGQYQPLL